MSRSYKRTPVCKDRVDRFFKHYANRVVRRKSELYQFGSYRRLYERWIFCDYRFHHTKERYLTFILRLDHYYDVPDDSELLLYWSKCYRWK